MPVTTDGKSRSFWLAIVAAAAALGVIVVVIGLWAGAGNSQISAAGWVAMILGVVLTLALGIGLMSLVFFSSRRGYDDDVEPRG
jgi:hypothetical protein